MLLGVHQGPTTHTDCEYNNFREYSNLKQSIIPFHYVLCRAVRLRHKKISKTQILFPTLWDVTKKL